MTLRLRLSVILACALLATVIVGATYLMFSVRQTIAEELNTSAELSARLIALVLAPIPADTLQSMTAELDERLANIGETRVLRIGLSTDTEFASRAARLSRPAGVPGWFVRMVHPEPRKLVREVDVGAESLRVVLRADPTNEISESWREVRPLLLMLLVFGGAAIVLVYLTLGRALRSLHDVARALLAVEAGDFGTRVPRVGVDDVDIIAERFNQMSTVLDRSRTETQMLVRRSLAIEEDERRRLAHELHDELGQSISAIKALAVSIRDRAPSLDATVRTSANTIVDVSSDVYDRVRRMMAHLRPVGLDELGLVSALQNMVDDWNAHHEDTFCQFKVDGTVPKLADDVAISCYRIVQEALTNIAKHAKAEQASIELRWVAHSAEAHGRLELIIADDGTGFDIRLAPRGLGLVGIQERVDAIHGTMEMTSSRHIGTRYVIQIPPARSVVDRG